MNKHTIVVVENARRQRFELHRATCPRVEGRALSSLLPDFDWSSTSYGEPISVSCCKVGQTAIDKHFRVLRGEVIPEKAPKPASELVDGVSKAKNEAKAIMWVLKNSAKNPDLGDLRAARAGVKGLGMLLDELIDKLLEVENAAKDGDES